MPALASPYGTDNFYDTIVALLTPIIQMTADYAGTIALPFARYVELGETYTYFAMSRDNPAQRMVISESQFELSIYAMNRELARQLGRQVMNAMDDYKAVYNDGRIMYIEPISAIFIPEPRSGPSTPTVFHRSITFALMEQRGI